MLSLRHETNSDLLRQAALLLDNENKRLLKENVKLRKEISFLRGDPPPPVQQSLQNLEDQLAANNRRLFGPSSEKLVKPSVKEKKARKKQTGHGPRVQPGLPIEEKVHVLDEADMQCPKCGGHLSEIVGQFEQSEEITIVSRKIVLVKHKRQKYKCTCQACIETAIGPTKLIPGGRYSVEFAVETAIDKYLDHLPLTRQSKRMLRQGLKVDSQTLWDQIQALGTKLKPVADAIKEKILNSSVVFADETSWRMLNTGTKKWQLWAIANSDLVYYHADPSRSKGTAAKLLGEYDGILMSDGYAVYKSLARDAPQMNLDGSGGHKIISANCWAHVRRKFVDIEKNYPRQCDKILRLIGTLYKLEHKAKNETERILIRNKRSRKVINAIKKWMNNQSCLPESGLAKAINYMNKLWSGLTAFLKNPEIPLDNNQVERAMRGPVLGRKNHLGSKSKLGAEMTSVFYTIIESAKLCGVEPKEYLLKAAKAIIQNPSEILLPSS